MSHFSHHDLVDWIETDELEEHYREYWQKIMAAGPKLVSQDGGVTVFLVTDPLHEQAVGRHIYNPSEEDLALAVKAAAEQRLEVVWIHGEIQAKKARLKRAA